MQLKFRLLSAGEMERPPTQRDQFNNDDVGLAEALVREALQNSLDARWGDGLVHVRFDLFDLDRGDTSEFLEFLDIDRLRDHLAAAEMLPGDLDRTRIRLLIIEDFGTTGLQGSTEEMDKQAFSDFWRRMGLSHKKGKSLGRWGLGKLVFSSASGIRSFFGLTVRREDPGISYLMGQAVLTNHEIGQERFDSHGFFAVHRKDGMQLPETAQNQMRAFRRAARLARAAEPGLSIVVPYALPSLSVNDIMQAALRNYFFPILMGQLSVRVGTQEINSETFASLAEQYGRDRFTGGHLVRFIEMLKLARAEQISPVLLDRKWVNESMPLEDCLGGNLERLRQDLAEGRPVFVRAPLLLKRVDGSELSTHFDLFLLRIDDAPGDVLFVRDTIVLSAEARYFRGKNVFAALIASDPTVSSFLGDAENPAHTSWSSNAEKLTANWKTAAARLRMIRYSLSRLYAALHSPLETVDPNALVDVFSIAADNGVTGGGRKRGSISPTPPSSLPPPKPKSFRLARKTGGFALKPGTALEPDQLPMTIRVRAAYDVLRGNPFARHDPLDFDFTKNEMIIVCKGATVDRQSANVLVAEITHLDFDISVEGFDVQRDLIVDPVRVQ